MSKLNPPDSFNFGCPTEWPSWRQRFLRYRTATKLSKEDTEVQISTLIYAMGIEAENIFKLFTFVEGESAEDYETVLGKFDEHFMPKRNVIHERACFHQRVQKPGENVECYIRALYELSEHCEFGASRNEHIRDRLVVGIRDKELSRDMQLMTALTLAAAVQVTRQTEDAAKQISQQEGQPTGSVQEDIMTPSVDIMTPSVDIMTPSVVILSELKSMKERIKVMEEEINELRKENREQNNQLQTLNASLKTRTEEPLPKDNDIRVAFSAFLLDSKGPTIVGPFASDRVLVYKYIFLNIGEAYDPNTGVFTAPMKGAYTFRVFSKGIGYSGHSVMAALFKNGKHMFSTHVDQSGGFYSSSNGVSLLLETGDTINVRLYAGTCIFDNGEHHHSSFSGELLFPL